MEEAAQTRPLPARDLIIRNVKWDCEMAEHIEPRRRPFLFGGSAHQAESPEENTLCLDREGRFSAVKEASHDSTKITIPAMVFPSRGLRRVTKVRDYLQFVCCSANQVM